MTVPAHRGDPPPTASQTLVPLPTFPLPDVRSVPWDVVLCSRVKVALIP